jgi:hypothetical protein
MKEKEEIKKEISQRKSGFNNKRKKMMPSSHALTIKLLKKVSPGFVESKI